MHVLVLVGVVSKNACMLCGMYKTSVIMVRIVSVVVVQVKLLKDVLEEWKKEVDKKPPEMSVDEAYDTLGLKTGVGR